MIQFYVIDADGNVVKEGSATNEKTIYAQAKEGEEVVFGTPPDLFEQFTQESI